MVSGSVTSTTWQRSASWSSSSTSSACARTGPELTASARPAAAREERDRVTGRRSVDDDQVVLAGAFELLDLAEHDDVVDPRRRRADDVDDTGAVQSLGDAGEAVVAEVLVERVGRRDRQHLDVGQQLGQRRLAVEFDDQHAASGIRCGTGDHSRYRGLPHTALARHHDDAGSSQRLQRELALWRHLCED